MKDRRWERGHKRERGRTVTGTGVETLGQTQDGNGDESGDGNESSSGDGNGDEDENGDGNEDGIGEGGRETKTRNKSHESCRHAMCEKRETLVERRKYIDKTGLVQYLPTQIIYRIARLQGTGTMNLGLK